MKTPYIILLAVGLIIASLIGSSVSYFNYGVRAEQGIKSAYENNENILAQYSLRVSEAAQVPAKYTEDLRAVYSDAMTGRYGENGSGAVMQWIQEQNPQLSPEMYTNLQNIMVAGRTKFENAQTELVDRKRAYNTELGSAWSGFVLGIVGYPKIDLDDYNIITSLHAKDAFESGIDAGIKI
jgi:hypothetical protein